ncbi:hypothetical protein HMF3257_27450 [Spirosoma telluris]|uniref:Uncharacterized protein n=1 Tax=Spirosoma telluris TaxID=2183553 RepID=A0A327NNQ9_9BACT|nr:hypothetical protein HMF3257_27450 [Spirosoma telluris]
MILQVIYQANALKTCLYRSKSRRIIASTFRPGQMASRFEAVPGRLLDQLPQDIDIFNEMLTLPNNFPDSLFLFFFLQCRHSHY